MSLGRTSEDKVDYENRAENYGEPSYHFSLNSHPFVETN